MKASKCSVGFFLTVFIIASSARIFSAAAIDPRAQKLEALLTQLDAFLLPESSGSEGMMDSLAIAAANRRLAGEILPRMRKTEPLLVAYFESRLLDNAFAKKVAPLLGAGFFEAGAKLARAYQERESISINLSGQPDKRRQAIALLDIPGQLDALEKKIYEAIDSLGSLDPEANSRWKPVFELLQYDLAQQIKVKTRDYTDEIKVSEAMRKAFWYAVEVPQEYEAAYLQLTAGREKLKDVSDLFFRALRPGTNPMQFLQDETGKTLLVMKQMDAKLAQVVEPLMQREDKESPLRGLDGIFNLRQSIRRQAEAVRYGQQIYALYLLMDLVEAYKASDLWTHSGDRSIWSGRGDFDRLELSYNILREYGERWRKNPKTAPLCGLIEMDAQGAPVPTLGGWLQWRLLGVEDIGDFEDEGRIVSIGGRRFVAPPGVSTKGIITMKDLLALGNINELVTVLDLNSVK